MKYVIESEAIHKHRITVEASNPEEAQELGMQVMAQGDIPYEVETHVSVKEAFTLDQG